MLVCTLGGEGGGGLKKCIVCTHENVDIFGWPLTKLDLSEKFINRQPVSINSVWVLLHEYFCNNWEDNIKMMPKLRTYILNLRRFLRLNHMFCHL